MDYNTLIQRLEKFQASVAEYDRDSAMATIDEVSEEFILDMILENE